jgi:3-methyladenine DNA glycosylase AlkD
MPRLSAMIAAVPAGSVVPPRSSWQDGRGQRRESKDRSMTSPTTATQLTEALWAARSDAELPKVRKRLADDEEAFGLRMRDLFALAKEATGLPLTEVHRLLDHPAYEPRMAAMCILDFKARRRLDDDQRRELFETYLGRHDRITTWDMVDRSAPRVVGSYLVGRSPDPLHDLAAHEDPLRRRTAITAPLAFIHGSDADLAGAFAIAARLAEDPDPTVHKPVGIFLKHASTRDASRVQRFLDDHATTMPRPAVRLAIEKLDHDQRRRYLT